MKLSREQIQKIEAYINFRKVNYIDLKLEILDHIISDIEHLINKGFSFEKAFLHTKKRWNLHFSSTNSLYFGTFYFAPRIVIENAKKIIKPFFYTTLVIYFIPILFLRKFNFYVEENLQFYLNIIIKSIAVITTLFMAYINFKYYAIKIKSTYSFILKTQIPNFFIGLIVIFHDSFSKNGKLQGITIALIFIIIYTAIFANIIYKKHLKEVEKGKRLKLL